MLLIYISLILSNYVSFVYFCDYGAPYSYVSEFAVVIKVDSCALAFFAALKRSALFTVFCTHLPNFLGDVLGENEAIRLSKCQCIIRMTLKVIFKGKNGDTIALIQHLSLLEYIRII